MGQALFDQTSRAVAHTSKLSQNTWKQCSAEYLECFVFTVNSGHGSGFQPLNKTAGFIFFLLVQGQLVFKWYLFFIAPCGLRLSLGPHWLSSNKQMGGQGVGYVLSAYFWGSWEEFLTNRGERWKNGEQRPEPRVSQASSSQNESGLSSSALTW